MRLLLLGNNGQLGWELERTLATLGEVIPLDYPAVDLADEGQVRLQVERLAPLDVIVNAAAYTAVDRAESEPELAYAVNARAVQILAEMAASLRAVFIHFSTDYVFDGLKGAPYVETDPPHPLGVYAASKLAGEQAIERVGGAYLILRTAWVYASRRQNFVASVLRWARQQTALKIVTDQVSNPTWARLLAETTAQILAVGGRQLVPWIAERRGLYHLAGDGYCSRFEWAQEILRLDPRREEQIAQALLPAQTSEFPTPATRPLFSALDCAKFTQTFGLRLPPWQLALRLAMVE